MHVDQSEVNVEWHGDNSHLSEEISTFAHQKWWRENSTFDSSNLRFAPFDLKNEADRYLAYRRESYQSIYGTGLPEGELWLKQAEANAQAHPRAVSLALIYDTPVGLIELDTHQGQPDKAGVIDFIYMIPEQRRMGIAVQLLGQAVSVYRSLGREKLRITVSEHNEQTLGFCQKYGFNIMGVFENKYGRHFIMEMSILLQ